MTEPLVQKNLRDILGVNRLIHEPARLVIMTILYSAKKADFLFLERETGLTRGNLSSHLTRLEEAGYLKIEKTFIGKTPSTLCHLEKSGRKAFDEYRNQIRSAFGS